MSKPELLKIVSLEPAYLGQPTPEVLRCFQILLFGHSDGMVSLRVDFCTQSMLESPKMSPDRVTDCIESIIVGLRFGHVAAGYRKEGNMWVPKRESFQSKQ